MRSQPTAHGTTRGMQCAAHYGAAKTNVDVQPCGTADESRLFQGTAMHRRWELTIGEHGSTGERYAMRMEELAQDGCSIR